MTKISKNPGILIVRNRKDQNATSYYDGLVAFNSSGVPNTTSYTLSDILTGCAKSSRSTNAGSCASRPIALTWRTTPTSAIPT